MQEVPCLEEPIGIAIDVSNDLKEYLGSTLKLPTPEMMHYYKLEQNRILYLDSSVTAKSLEITKQILIWNQEDAGISPENRKPIWLYIYSPGGDMDMMWCIVDAIEVSETPVYTVNAGVAASAASIIFLAGHKRYMLPRSRLIIHEGSAKMAGDAVKVFDAGESWKRMLRLMKDYILARTRITAAALNRQKCHDWELDAEYCLKNGACEAIVSASSEIF